jgi:hypothetical protein
MPGIDYTLGLKTSGFSSGVQGALGKLASIGSAAAKLTAGAGLAAGAGAAALIAKSIGKAADMETLRTAFVPLLGGIKQARDRMAELAAFAAATPFELPEIAAASKTLETLTRGALSTGKGLTLVGDVASATNQPFSEIAVTVGRLYDGLQSGRPVGEVLMRLQELGVVSGETRGRLEDLQESGAAGKDTWAVAEQALSRFTGSMKLQSGTWNGLMSTLGDTISAVMVKFGEPIMDSLKPYLEGAISRIEALQAAAARAGQVIGEAFSVIRAAFEGGQMFELAIASLKVGFLEAVNVLSKGVQAALKMITDSFAGESVVGIFTNLGKLVGNAISESLYSAIDKLPDWIKGRSFQNEIDWAKYGQERAGAHIKVQAGDLKDEIFGGAAIKDFQRTFSGISDMPELEKARQKLKDIYRPLQGAAAADSVSREAFAEADAAAIVKKPGESPGDALAATTRKGGGNAAAGDRLAQIGMYVGGSASALAQKAAEQTAKWTQQSAGYLKTLASRGGMKPALTF